VVDGFRVFEHVRPAGCGSRFYVAGVSSLSPRAHMSL
jgi:hypothetical protein